MSPRLVLTALVVVAASAARALPVDPDLANAAPAMDCPYFYAEVPKVRGDALLRVPPPKRECEFLKSLEEPFARLVSAAGLGKDAAVLSKLVIIEPTFNAYAAPTGDVFVNDKFVRKLIASRPAAIWMLAHEIGHVVQEREGELAQLNGVRVSAASAQEKIDFNRTFESKADRIAGDLLERAGYPLDFAEQVNEAMRGLDFR